MTRIHYAPPGVMRRVLDVGGGATRQDALVTPNDADSLVTCTCGTSATSGRGVHYVAQAELGFLSKWLFSSAATPEGRRDRAFLGRALVCEAVLALRWELL